MTVTSATFLICFTCSRGVSNVAKRRLGPTFPLIGVSDAEVSQPEDSEYPAARARWTPLCSSSLASSVSCRTDRRAPRALPVRLAVSRTSSSLPDGSARATKGTGSSISSEGARLSRTAIRSTPDIPSIMQWWIFETIAKVSSWSPSTMLNSHSGFDLSSCCDMMIPTRSRSCSSVPGRGRL